MAIGRLSVKVGGAGKAGAHAEYIAREGRYANRLESGEKLEATEFGNMPTWAAHQPQLFWQAADQYERKNGTTYREFEVALPRELTPEQRLDLVREFVAKEIGDRHAYQFAIHTPTATDGGEQPHAHIMFSERQLDGIDRDPDQYFKRYNAKAPERGGARKSFAPLEAEQALTDEDGMHRAARQSERAEKLQQLRGRWEQTCNQHLERAGQQERIDMRSYRDQGVDLQPTPKMLPSEGNRVAREAKAIRAEIVELAPRIAARERELAEIRAEVEAVAQRLDARPLFEEGESKLLRDMPTATLREARETRGEAQSFAKYLDAREAREREPAPAPRAQNNQAKKEAENERKKYTQHTVEDPRQLAWTRPGDGLRKLSECHLARTGGERRGADLLQTDARDRGRAAGEVRRPAVEIDQRTSIAAAVAERDAAPVPKVDTPPAKPSLDQLLQGSQGGVIEQRRSPLQSSPPLPLGVDIPSRSALLDESQARKRHVKLPSSLDDYVAAAREARRTDRDREVDAAVDQRWAQHYVSETQRARGGVAAAQERIKRVSTESIQRITEALEADTQAQRHSAQAEQKERQAADWLKEHWLKAKISTAPADELREQAAHHSKQAGGWTQKKALLEAQNQVAKAEAEKALQAAERALQEAERSAARSFDPAAAQHQERERWNAENPERAQQIDAAAERDEQQRQASREKYAQEEAERQAERQANQQDRGLTL